MNRRGWTVIAVVLVAIVFVVMRGCGKPGLIVQDGQEYRIVSFGTTETQTTDEQGNKLSIPCYLITFTYASTSGGDEATPAESRGTVSVPKSVLIDDKSLQTNRIVWDKPLTLERLTYRQVRWNPGYKVPARENPILREQPPVEPSE